MNLVIDIGNTSTKINLFQDSRHLDTIQSDNLTVELIKKIISNLGICNRCIISASGNIPETSLAYLKSIIPSTIVFSQQTPKPFKTKYKTPNTLGLDRLAAVAGAIEIYPGKNVLIIDAGTAITYDIKDETDEHIGGNISPGLEMRFKALNNFTARLPLINPQKDFYFLGEQTNDAIRNGVMNGILFEIRGMINETKKNYRNLTVILTGGDAPFFDNQLKKAIFVYPKLVSIGLNTILNYNVATI